ncbi:hypothetical protein NYA30BAC_00589 [Halomonas sp. NYA30]
MLAIQPTDNSQKLSLTSALPDFIREGLNNWLDADSECNTR